MPSLFETTELCFPNGQYQQEIVGQTLNVVEADQHRALRLAVDLSRYSFDGSAGNSVDSRSTCSDPGYPDPTDIMQIAAIALRKSQNTTECVPVPSSEHVAEIVGRQGCKIKALRAKTNTYIKTPVRGEESVFVVTGRKEDVEAAKMEILSAADHFTQIRASRRHSQGGIPAPGHITAYVRVPYKFVGLVVGPKGATIKRIQQQTHTYIITPSRDKEPIFEVTGLSENVETARNEIQMHIVSRTGNFLTMLDDKTSADIMKDMAALMGNDDFQSNGTDTAYDDDVAAVCDALNQLHTQQQPNVAICKPAHQQSNSTNVHQTGRNFLSTSQVQNRYSAAWSINGTMNSSSSDQDEGVWSTGGESPTSLAVDPLFPSYLSSIWSELDNPKDIIQKRSASISVPETDTQAGSWFGAVGSQLTSASNSWSSSSTTSHTSARRLQSAPVIGAGSLYRQTMDNNNCFSLSVPVPMQTCSVCEKQPVQASLEPCGHRCFCFLCATRLRQMPSPICPLCKTDIKTAVRFA